ncbi:molybdopterin-dependent oxidoreductase [Phenylobacterium sp.]|uniref:molybdopterin-dependent oxidoreductase n=1 Tax=Phenylobacterium sp. TaxID=1871053 RepID=UPI002E37624F|nr:molybdopterin-dependent oxidoreductase [Phenylobacterium sp.]HEX4710329.1 molybdopterin-dependent oxidoreductase [Phenylobacterium sp.]
MTDRTRRQLLQTMAGLGAAELAGCERGANKTTTFPFENGTREIVPAGTFPEKAAMILQRTRPPLLETPWSVLGSNVFTPNESFFVRWHLPDFPTDIDIDTYRVRVFGHVEAPYELSLQQLMEGFQPIDLAAVNQCSGNSRGRVTPRVAGAQWLDGAMSNALWTGVPLSQLLAQAKPLPGATHVAFRSRERLFAMFPSRDLYEKYVPFAKANDGEVIVAYGMNGKQMPVLNGSPIRLIVPGWYSTYWVKMLSEIEVTTHPGPNLWMADAYKVPNTPNGGMKPGETGVEFVPISAMNPRSFLSNLQDGARLPVGRPFEIRGLAFGGDAALTSVDLSSDGGASWQPAKLGKDWGKYSFRLWSFTYAPQRAGKTTLIARATPAKGEQQPMVGVWNPGGFMYNAAPRVSIVAG